MDDLNYIPLKDLPNRKTCPMPGCDCTPVMEKLAIPNPFGGDPVFVDAPKCERTSRSLATLEEGCYGQLIACRDFLKSDGIITGQVVHKVRRCLGFTIDELQVVFPNNNIKAIEDAADYPAPTAYYLGLLGLVMRQIHRYES